MKRLSVLLLIAVSAVAAAQQAAPAAQPQAPASNVVERVNAPTYSDLNCAGFISKEKYSHANYLVAGDEAPMASQFNDGDTVFLEGTGYSEGQRYSVIRELRDPNRYPAFTGQPAAIAAVGQPYQELGHLRITGIRGNIAIAKVEFSCTAMVAGDLVVPYVEKQQIPFHPPNFDRFPPDGSGVGGRIVMAKEFDVVVGPGQKVYLDIGSNKGVKVGDYFRAVRNYDPKKQDPVEALAYKTQQTEDTMKTQIKVLNSTYATLPKRTLGEMMVISVTPTSATAIITNSVEHINVGDMVELEGTAAKE